MVMKRKLHCARLASLLLIAAFAGTVQAGQTYWVCDDAQGNPTAQDHPCDPADPAKNRREARPNVVPAPNAAAEALSNVRSSARQAATRAPALSPDLIKGIAGFGVIALLVLVAMGIRSLFRRRAGGDVNDAMRIAGLAEPEPATPLTFLRRPKAWGLPLIRSLGVQRFVELCASLWAAEGYRTESCNSDEQSGFHIRFFDADEAGKPLGIIRCKSGLVEPVGINDARELYARIADTGAKQGILVTRSDFTADAQVYAGGKPIELIDGAMLLRRLQALPKEAGASLLRQIVRRGYRR